MSNLTDSALARRSFLSGAAALSAVAVPSIASAGALPDAALIATAAGVLALAVEHQAAQERYCDLESEVERLTPIKARPSRPGSVQTAVVTYERVSDDDFVMRSVPITPDPDALLAAEHQQASIDAWEAEREEIAERIGVHDADDLRDELYDRLEAAVIDLTPMTPKTLAGLVAKARAAVQLDPADDFALNDWEHELRAAVLRDLVAIGGRPLTRGGTNV